MVFGVFDHLHDGHRHFLHEATRLGTALIIVVAQDAQVKTLKSRSPKETLSTRIARIQREFPQATVVAGDEESSDWSVVRRFAPDRIALGYDQAKLKDALSFFEGDIIIIGSYKPDTLHSSLL